MTMSTMETRGLLAQSSVETTDFDEWESVVTTSLVPLSAEPVGDGDFYGTLVAVRAGDVGVLRGASVPQVVSRSALRCRRNPSGTVAMLIQRQGRHAIDANDARVAGDGHTLTLFDLDSPYTIAEHDAFRADAFIIPRHIVGDAPRLFARARFAPVRIESGAGRIFASTLDQLMSQLDCCAADTALRMLGLAVDMFRIVIGDLETPEAPAEVMHHAAIDWIRRT